VARSISTGVYPHRVRVLLHAPLESVAERIPPLAGQLARVSEERCLLETGGHTLGFDFEVQDPPELREQLRELGQRLTRSTR
jgi:hypothetical protein